MVMVMYNRWKLFCHGDKMKEALIDISGECTCDGQYQ